MWNIVPTDDDNLIVFVREMPMFMIKCIHIIHDNIFGKKEKFRGVLMYTPVMYDFTPEDRYWIELEDQ